MPAVLMQQHPLAYDEMRTARLNRFNQRRDGTSSAPTPAPSAIMDASTLFTMGFEPESVGRALVATRGDVHQALAMLHSDSGTHFASSTRNAESERPVAAAAAEEDDDEELARAIQMSLEKQDCSTSLEKVSNAHTAHPHEPTPDHNPLWNPPRYIPMGGADALRVVGGKTLSLIEDVEVRDAGYSWQRAKAFLDTGNQHITIVDTNFARKHAIYAPRESTPPMPWGTSFGQVERYVTIRGVVPGASSRAPCVTIALKIRGEEFIIQAAVSEMGPQYDLLLGVDVLGRLFTSGFQIGAGSM